ncbi:terminal nucleotidyltransferase 4A-like [Lytechinus pictus]|uniref:terminal nucleotidyltransferase 4A-like n=1 Tax=Lytechinus pictus TaxID=7653 RepID=UPI00240CF374|nr:terminal nucleotidyltransferase 4A-like [Lytechinus pictus]
MDPRVSWYQPEQLGRATDLWTQIFDSATLTEELQNFHVGDSMSKGGTGSPSPNSRSGAGTRTAPDYIPLNGDNTSHSRKKKGANGFIFGDRQETINRKRKDNLASTYDWNHSGKLRNGGTPWRMPSQRYCGIIGLHHEIIDFYHFMLPRYEEHHMRREVVQRIQGIVRSIWPKAKVEIYGSTRTMLYLPTSDIDLVLFGDIGESPFFRLGNELEKSGIAEQGSIKVLDKASVPIVKLTDNVTKVRVDISFNMQTGTDCAKLIEEFICQFPSLPFMVFALKQFLLQRDLNEVWTGGISSYSLILMIVSFLQLHAPPEPENLGVLLIEFFELYGNNFNYFKTGISVNDGGYYFSKEDAQRTMTQGYRTSMLCIEDPLNPGQDITKNSYGFMSVKQAFHYAYRVLCQAAIPHIDQEDETDSILGRIIRVTDEVVAYRQWVQQHWYHKVAHLIPPAMIPSLHYLHMVAMNQLPLPDNTAMRIDNQSNQQQQQQQQQQKQGNNNNNPTTLNNNNLSARTTTPTTSCSSPSPIPSEEGGVDKSVTLAGQGLNELRTESTTTTTTVTTTSTPTQLQKLAGPEQVQLSPESPPVIGIPTSPESDVNSTGTLSSPSSQDDLSSCSDAESEHSSASSKDSGDSMMKSLPLPLPPPGRHINATVTVTSTSMMTPSIMVSSSTSQRTATPPIIKPSAVLLASSTNTTVTGVASKPKPSNKDSDVLKSVSVSSVVVTHRSEAQVAPTTSTVSTTSSPSVTKVLPGTTTATSIQQPVTSRTYRNKSHQYNSQQQQSSGKYRSSSASSSNNNNTTGNGSASGGKRLKRRHKQNSAPSNR